MPVEDFVAAAYRHADDAEALLRDERADNAAYLAGYAFECGLKVLVRASPHYTGTMPWIHDLVSLETLALAATLAQADAEQSFPQEAITTARSTGWDVAWRYVPDGSVPSTDVTALVAAAQDMRDALSVAVMDGRVRP